MAPKDWEMTGLSKIHNWLEVAARIALHTVVVVVDLAAAVRLAVVVRAHFPVAAVAFLHRCWRFPVSLDCPYLYQWYILDQQPLLPLSAGAALQLQSKDRKHKLSNRKICLLISPVHILQLWQTECFPFPDCSNRHHQRKWCRSPKYRQKPTQ